MQKTTFFVKPNARSNSIGKGQDGNLWVRISAPPSEGKANLALISFFSELVSIPKSHIQLVNGSSGRYKTFLFDGPPIDWDLIISGQM
jgi:hypothetical protein